MKYLASLALVAVLGLSFATTVDAAQYVSGYYKSNGTYVNGYYRSSPDSNPYNNYSYPGNTNPYTGKTATGNPSTYLNNYYKTSNSYSYSNTYTLPTRSYSFGQPSYSYSGPSGIGQYSMKPSSYKPVIILPSSRSYSGSSYNFSW